MFVYLALTGTGYVLIKSYPRQRQEMEEIPLKFNRGVARAIFQTNTNNVALNATCTHSQRSQPLTVSDQGMWL